MSNEVFLHNASSQISQAESNETANLKFFELELSPSQFKSLQKLLPKGFSLEILSKGRRDATPRPSKKVFTNEGNAVKRTASNEFNNIPFHDPNGSMRKISLREKKKSHFEERYPDFEAIPTTSSKSVKPSSGDGAKKCLNLLQRLKKHQCAGPFLQPVDVEGLGLEDYYDIVTEPMDLGTVEQKLRNHEYTSVNGFAADVKKIWNNAFRYNAKGSEIYKMTNEMSNAFEKMFKEIEHVSFNDTIRELEEKVKKYSKQIKEYNRGGRSHPTSKSSKSFGALDKPMTQEEKKQLGQNIRSLPPDHLRGVWEIVSHGLPSLQNKEEIEFDIDSLPTRITRELERFVKSKLNQMNKSVQNKKKGKETATSQQIMPPMIPYDNIPKTQQYVEPLEDFNARAMIPENYGTETLQPPTGNNQVDDDDKSSESSFISDSDDENSRQRHRISDNLSQKKQQELASFQAGGHGSMLNSFIVK